MEWNRPKGRSPVRLLLALLLPLMAAGESPAQSSFRSLSRLQPLSTEAPHRPGEPRRVPPRETAVSVPTSAYPGGPVLNQLPQTMAVDAAGRPVFQFLPHPNSALPGLHQPTIRTELVDYVLQSQPGSQTATETTESRRRKNSARDSIGNFIGTNRFTFWNDWLNVDGFADYPDLGRFNLADNNSPMPRDRCYFIFNHFHNVADRDIDDFAGTSLDTTTLSIDRYTFGYEKTFSEGQWSLDVRMPFFGNGDWLSNTGVGASNPAVGNLAVTFKRIVRETDRMAISAGVGVSTPTGDDVKFTFADQEFIINNKAVNLFPFYAFLIVPNDRFFLQGFVHLNIPVGGNEIEFRDLSAGGARRGLGKLVDQNLLFVDFSTGYWLYRNDQSSTVTGVASLVELHYTTALDSAQSSAGAISGAGANTGYDFSSTNDRFDFVTFAVGLDTEIANRTTFRVAGIVPLSSDDNNFFDSEIHVSVNRAF